MTLSSVGSSSQLLQLRQAMFSKADADGDGQLSSDEFLSIGQNMQGGGNSGSAKAMKGEGCGPANFASATLGSLLSMQEAAADHEARAAEMFAGADADSDGKVTAEELATDMAAHAPPGMEGFDTTRMAASFLANADTDGDGALSEDEFKAARPPAPPHGMGGPGAAASSEEDKKTDPLDTNGDGVVSMTELLASLQTTAQSQSTDFSTEVSDMLQKLLAKLTEETTAASTATTTTAEAA